MDLSEHLPPERWERTRAWTVVEKSDGFEVRFHVVATTRERIVRTVVFTVSIALLVALAFDIAMGHGFRPWGLGYIVLVAAGHVYVAVRTLWKQNERLRIAAGEARHQYMGRRGSRTDRMPLGSTVAIEVGRAERGFAGVRFLLWASGAVPGVMLHCAGRTLRVGRGLVLPEARTLRETIRERLGPERNPVPGQAGEVRGVGAAVRTAFQLDRVDKQQRPVHSLNHEGGGAEFLFMVCLAAFLVGGVVTLISGLDRSPVASSISLLGLLGVPLFLPERGLIHVLRNRAIARRRAAQPDEPWEWHGRWPQGRVVKHAAASPPFVGMVIVAAVLAGAIATAGPPRHTLLIPVWLAFIAVVLSPLAMRLWQVGFSGATEVRPATLPLRPVTRAELRFAVSNDGAGFDEIAFRLLRTELRPASKWWTSDQYWTTHEAEYLLPSDQPPPGPNEEVAALFDLPADAGPTDEDAVVRVRWFLEVRGQRSCGAFSEVFEVPVFAS